MKKSKLMILVAGPYRTGTDDDPVKIEHNMFCMEVAAMEVLNMGHIPILGEWFALPLIARAGSKKIGDEIFDRIFHPISEDILAKCDAVFRIGGKSFGADQMVEKGREMGKFIFNSISEIEAHNNF